MLYQLMFTLCIVTCKETPVNFPYDSLEACQHAAAIEEPKALIAIRAARQGNIKVKFECRKVN